MTSPRPWHQSLTTALSQKSSAGGEPPRVAVVGVGHELDGDDVAGVAVARELATYAAACDHLLVIDAGPAPENVTGALRHFDPDLIVFVDAAHLGETPGTVEWLPWQQTEGLSASSHTLPLHMVAKYLESELGATVALIGIQPADISQGAPVSEAVRIAVAEVTAGIVAAVCPPGTA